MGHIQLQIVKGAPCVDISGKPLKNQPKVHGLSEDQEQQWSNAEGNIIPLNFKIVL